MALKKVFITSNNLATFVCPECQNSRTRNVAQYKDIETAVKVKCKCPCGHTYNVLLERRKDLRKSMDLPGTYSSQTQEGVRGTMVVKNLSRSGMNLEMNMKMAFQIGERLNIEFNLDDSQRSLIRKEVIIRSIRGTNIGVEFTTKDHYDQLGPYLLYSFN